MKYYCLSRKKARKKTRQLHGGRKQGEAQGSPASLGVRLSCLIACQKCFGAVPRMLDKLVARLSALRLTLVRGKVRAPRPRAAPAPPWDA